MNKDNISKIFRVLGDDTRMDIVNMLYKNEMCAADILERVDISQPTLSHHMKLLIGAEIVRSRKESTMTMYSLNMEFFPEIAEILLEYGTSREDRADEIRKFLNGELDSEKDENYHKKILSIAADAKQANAIKTEFLKSISYDLRQNINSVKGILSIAKKDSDNIQVLNNCYEKISDTVVMLEEMIADIVGVCEIEDELNFANYQPSDIYDNFREIKNVSSIKAEKAGMTYKCESIGGVLHPYIRSSNIYEKKIYQLIIDEIFKYGKAGDAINVSFEETGNDEENVYFRVVICSSNVFISDDFIEGLNDPLGYSFDDFEGPGLVLATVKRLLAKIESTIRVDSDPQSGTVITVDIAYTIDHMSQAVMNHANKASINGKRILIAEDNDLNLEVAQFLLEDAGAVVVSAINGKQAVEIFADSAEKEFDLILMDITMPVMDGCEATREIRKLEREDARYIPIIAMSANAFESDIKVSKQCGMNEYITKPLDQKKIISVLKKWL